MSEMKLSLVRIVIMSMVFANSKNAIVNKLIVAVCLVALSGLEYYAGMHA